MHPLPHHPQFVHVRASVLSSMVKTRPYSVRICLTNKGFIHTAYCVCPAGLGGLRLHNRWRQHAIWEVTGGNCPQCEFSEEGECIMLCQTQRTFPKIVRERRTGQASSRVDRGQGTCTQFSFYGRSSRCQSQLILRESLVPLLLCLPLPLLRG